MTTQRRARDIEAFLARRDRYVMFACHTPLLARYDHYTGNATCVNRHRTLRLTDSFDSLWSFEFSRSKCASKACIFVGLNYNQSHVHNLASMFLIHRGWLD